MSDPDDPRVPVNSALLGYGPMLPLVVGGAAAWAFPPVPWGALACGRR